MSTMRIIRCTSRGSGALSLITLRFAQTFIQQRFGSSTRFKDTSIVGRDPQAQPKKLHPKELKVKELKNNSEIDDLLSTPTWSVTSLLPTSHQSSRSPSVTINQLHHLLRLSALPKPESESEEREMLLTLSSQLHFVEEIQRVDTTKVEPLRAIRDETESAEKESEVTLARLQEAFAQEDLVGKHYKRIRRRQERPSLPENPEGWRPLDHAQSKVGKYFVVDSGQNPQP
jgi:Asp-tRNA(Asn)/Glu-tRNA(Gln) amidotransferase C subunit